MGKIANVLEWVRYNWEDVAAIIFAISVIIGLSYLIYQRSIAEQAEFMSYCTAKGHSEQDCRWEYKRMQNGQQSTVVMPIFVGNIR